MGWFSSDDEAPSIDGLVNDLSTGGVTVFALNALDYIVPGEWENITDFDEMIRQVTGDDDEEFVAMVRERAIELYNDSDEGYQTAVKLFNIVDTADKAIGAAALADKLADSFSMLSFMENITPKADTVQTIDLAIKIVVELVAFTKINGIPGDSIGDFVSALGDYGKESKMRMAALICYDGLIPLGPDFLNFVIEKLQGLTGDDLEENGTFKKVSEHIPGDGGEGKLAFITNSFDSVKDWMSNFMEEKNINVEEVLEKLSEYVEVADDKLDYVAAFLDVSTDYYAHTGTQTVAARLIERAAGEV